MQVLDTHRIDHLLSGAVVAEHEITVVGVGSGGASVIQQLAMCGIGRWNLFDPDRLEAVNLVKHPARRSDLGRPTAGCFSCVQLVADSNGWGIEDAIDLTDEERHHRYGLGEENFTTSGLAVDITLVASYHAHMVWSVLMGGRTPYVPRLNFNWLTIGVRPEKGVFTTHYTSNRVLVRPQKHCYLGCGLDGDPAATREE